MSYRCFLHGWNDAESPCRICFPASIRSSTTIDLSGTFKEPTEKQSFEVVEAMNKEISSLQAKLNLAIEEVKYLHKVFHHDPCDIERCIFFETLSKIRGER